MLPRKAPQKGLPERLPGKAPQKDSPERPLRKAPQKGFLERLPRKAPQKSSPQEDLQKTLHTREAREANLIMLPENEHPLNLFLL